VNKIIPRILFLIFGVAACLSAPDYTSTVISLLIAICISSLSAALDKKIFTNIACCIFYIICIIFDTPFIFFIPLTVYELTISNMKVTGYKPVIDKGIIAPALGVIFSIVEAYRNQTGFITPVMLSVFSVYLAYLYLMAEFYKNKSESEGDSKREVELLMRRHKEDYKKQQDNEVHVATLKERNRIAREIHDNVGHLLSRSLLMMGAIETVNKDENLKEPLSVLKSTLSDAMDSCRVSVHDLHDESIDLQGNLENLVKDFTFCTATLEYSAGSKINKDIKYCVITMVKEALSNVSVHSNATNVKIYFREHTNMYQLLIEDNGTVSINSDGTGIGLNNMHDRISSLGGTLYITNDSGFRIFATIPRANSVNE